MKKIGSLALLFVLALALTLSLFSSFSESLVAYAADVTSGSAYSAEWRLSGPTGGDVRGLVVDPSDPDRFYFGTLDGQIYTSSAAGHHWQLLYNFGKPTLFA